MRSSIIYCSILLLLGPQFCGAQSWSPVSSGITGDVVNTTWSLFAYDSMLYAGGRFYMAGGTYTNDIAQWNGVSWNKVGTGTGGNVNAMAWYNGNLYAGGQFDTMGGVIAHYIATWNGSSWDSVGKNGMKTNQHGVYCMAVYKGELYIGGQFDTIDGNPIFGIARWNDTNWSQLGTGIISTDEESTVSCMAVYNGDLYFGGEFVFSGGTDIAKWDGTTLSTVGGGAVGTIYSLATYNGNLYAGGQLNTFGATSANNIAMWNGKSWYALDSGITGESGWAIVTALASYNGQLYVGGYFDTVNGQPMNCIARWNGKIWSNVSTGISIGGGVDAMAVFDSALYVGGGFDSAGGVYANNIAMWTSPSSINEISEDNRIKVYPNPASNRLTIQVSNITDDVRYSIYDELGQQIETGRLALSKNNSIDVCAYHTGVYMICITTASGNGCSSKFIKN